MDDNLLKVIGQCIAISMIAVSFYVFRLIWTFVKTKGSVRERLVACKEMMFKNDDEKSDSKKEITNTDKSRKSKEVIDDLSDLKMFIFLVCAVIIIKVYCNS